MEWYKNSTFLKWLIGSLITLNIVTIAIIWIFIVQRPNRMPDPGEAFKRITKDLNLTPKQEQLFEQERKDFFKKSDVLFDMMSGLQSQLLDKLLNKNSNQSTVDSLIAGLGAVQSQIEKERFLHFKKFLSQCTPEQQQKFAPILKRMYSGKPGMRPGGHMPSPPPPGG